MNADRWRALSVALLSVGLFTCRSLPPSSGPRQYIVTKAPLSLSLPSRPLCVAADPADPHGVWWWEPGQTGCASRSTGPGVFHGERAAVAHYMRSQAIDVGFRVPLHGSPTNPDIPAYVDIALVVENGLMRSRDGSVRVPVEHRADLNLPELQPRR